MCQAVDKGVGHSFRDRPSVVVAHLVLNVDYRLLNVAHAVAQQVDGNHWQCVCPPAFLFHVSRVLIL